MQTQEKIPYYKKFNPIELWLWQNKKHLGALLKHTTFTSYGSRNSKWRYDISTGEFVWNQFKQVDKHQWSKDAVVKKIPAIKLLKGTNNSYSPMWIEFQKAVAQLEKEREKNN
mgnify:FL=1|tara:strand:- start:109 stop:447 length:339 start_codon:yes stop_codon:yes gene_type:complete